MQLIVSILASRVILLKPLVVSMFALVVRQVVRKAFTVKALY